MEKNDHLRYRHGNTGLDKKSQLLVEDRNREYDSTKAAPTFPLRNLLSCAGYILLLALLTSSNGLQIAPLKQIHDKIVCQSLHPEGGKDCSNSEAVQAELALLTGWRSTIDLILGVLTIIPYSFLADNYGRKFVLVLNLAGIMLCFLSFAAVCWWPDILPVRLTWVSYLFLLIGGGPAVLISVAFSALSDLVPEAYRSIAFFALSASTQFVDHILTTLVPLLMDYNVWLPVKTGLALYIPSILLVLCLPETLKSVKSSAHVSEDSITGTGHGPDEMGNEHRPLWSCLCDSFDKLRRDLMLLTRSKLSIKPLLLTSLIYALSHTVRLTLFSFARKKYGCSWSRSKTTELFWARAAAILLLLTVILPVVNFILASVSSMRPRQKDLNIARASSLFFLLGNLAIGTSTTEEFMVLGVIACAIGSAYDLIIRSLLSQLVEAHHRTMIFSTIAILEHLGAKIAGPIFDACFQIGLHLGDSWVGLPFFASGLFVAFNLFILYHVRV